MFLSFSYIQIIIVNIIILDNKKTYTTNQLIENERKNAAIWKFIFSNQRIAIRGH